MDSSFNIHARENYYKVTCFSGSVSVSDSENEKLTVLEPKQQIVLDEKGSISIKQDINIEQEKAWLENKFYFTSVQIVTVFKELERQYDIQIEYPDGLEKTYSGNFTKDIDINQIMDLICLPLNLTYKIEKDKIIVENL